MPANSVQELVTLIRSQPGKLSYASLGRPPPHHLAAAIFMSRMNIDILHVPYKGSPAAMLDLLSGRVDMIFQGGGSGLPPVRAGKLRCSLPLASSAPRRPPTRHEHDPACRASRSTLVRPGRSGRDAATDRRAAESRAVAVLRLPATSEKFVVNGVEIIPSTPEELGARIRADLPVWKKILQDAGVQPE